jgi:hypothetical protein
MTSSASFMFNHISADGKVITTITGAKTVKQPTPGFFQKYGSMLMIGAMLIGMYTYKKSNPALERSEFHSYQ